MRTFVGEGGWEAAGPTPLAGSVSDLDCSASLPPQRVRDRVAKITQQRLQGLPAALFTCDLRKGQTGLKAELIAGPCSLTPEWRPDPAAHVAPDCFRGEGKGVPSPPGYLNGRHARPKKAGPPRASSAVCCKRSRT